MVNQGYKMRMCEYGRDRQTGVDRLLYSLLRTLVLTTSASTVEDEGLQLAYIITCCGQPRILPVAVV